MRWFQYKRTLKCVWNADHLWEMFRFMLLLCKVKAYIQELLCVKSVKRPGVSRYHSRFREKSHLLCLFFLNLWLKKILIEPLLWARHPCLRVYYRCFRIHYLKWFRELFYDIYKAIIIIIIIIPIIALSTKGQRVQNASSILHSWEAVQATHQAYEHSLEFCYLWSNSASVVWPQASDISVPWFPQR